MTTEIIYIVMGTVSLAIGAVLGYLARQSIARYQLGSLEQIIQAKLDESRRESQKIIIDAKNKAVEMLDAAKKEGEAYRRELEAKERQMDKKQTILDQKIFSFDGKEKLLQEKVNQVRNIKANLESLQQQEMEKLEKIASLSVEEAKKIIFEKVEKESANELFQKTKKLEQTAQESYEAKVKEVLAYAIQKYTAPSINEFTISQVSIPNDEIKGRIIGKEGRNIRAFERATGVELIVDETPGVIFLSSFDSLRREIARRTVEVLIKDGRVQPSRIEEVAKKVEEEMPKVLRKIGEDTLYQLELFDVNPVMYPLIGRMKFRLSYGQNLLDHSIEVATIAEALASELGLNAKLAKKAGFLHDIGKIVSHEVEGSHVDIGIKILEKFKVSQDVIETMRAHHEEYPYVNPEGVVVQVADAISSSRMGARRISVEDYLKRLEDLEKIAVSFEGVDKAYAIQAGRELRVFVKSEVVDDAKLFKMSRDIADMIQAQASYPGEIKVVAIRETRAVEVAR